MDTSASKFHKPAPTKRKRNHSIRNKRRTKRGMVIDLDKVARREVVLDRDRFVCQRCGIVEGEWVPDLKRFAVIQWAHVHTREYYCIRWDADNSLALCSRCHVWFDNHKVLAYDWFAKKFPERWERIVRFLHVRIAEFGHNKTTDADIRELWQERCL